MQKLLAIIVFTLSIHTYAENILVEPFQKGTGYYDLVHYEWLSIHSRAELRAAKLGTRVFTAVDNYYKGVIKHASVNVIYSLSVELTEANAVVDATFNLDASFLLEERSGYYF